ncbi:hypothetical protein [Erwinia persicina]|uniref:hypothetical protein n=1 Tax=Erwinia persicina TaxID=55211 RepID=UPI00177F264C|nr:hypothetical protein [Erwinia persicina]MBD8213722.1 hypothetical protein [Erwinia persicina]
MSLSEANANADRQTENVHAVQLHSGTNSAAALQAGAVAGQASVQRQQVSQQDFGAYRRQQVQDAHQKTFGQAYTDAKNEVNQPASQPSSGYGQSYTDAKNEVSQPASQPSSGYGQSYTDAKNNQSAGWVQQPGNITNPQGNPVSMVNRVKNDPTGTPVSMVAGVKQDPTGKPVTGGMPSSVQTQMQGIQASLTATKYAAATINVAASSLQPTTQVNPVSMVAGVKQDPTGKPVTGGMPSSVQTQMQGIQASLTAAKYAAATINVAASSLQPTTQVNVTLAGVTKTLPASVLAPDVQVAVPHIPALIHEGRGNGVSHDKATGRVSGDNRGSDNAHSHAFGGHGYGADNSRSEGFGGHSHFH